MTLHSLIPRRSVFRAPMAHPGLRAFWPVDFDRFFDEVLSGPDGGQGETTFTPRIDVRETDDAYEVCADLPGLEEKDIQLSVEEGVLTIQGKLETGHEEERKGLRYAERRKGTFQRTIELDPTCAPAYVGTAQAYRAMVITGDRAPVEV